MASNDPNCTGWGHVGTTRARPRELGAPIYGTDERLWHRLRDRVLVEFVRKFEKEGMTTRPRPGTPPCCVGRASSTVAVGEETVALPQLQLLRISMDGVNIPDAAQRQFPTVFQTMEIPQLQSIDKVFDVPVFRSSCFLGCSLCEDSRDPRVAAQWSMDAWYGPVHRHRARVDPHHQGCEGVAGSPESDSQVTCYPNWMHAVCVHIDRDMSATHVFEPPPHHTHTTPHRTAQKRERSKGGWETGSFFDVTPSPLPLPFLPTPRLLLNILFAKTYSNVFHRFQQIHFPYKTLFFTF